MKSKLAVFMMSAIFLLTCVQVDTQKYESNWRSVRQINTPQWLRDGNFGVYTPGVFIQ